MSSPKDIAESLGAALSSTPVSAEQQPSEWLHEKLTPDEAWELLCNSDDRTSPEEYPDHALITKEELASYMERAVCAPKSAELRPVAWRFRATYANGNPVPGWQFSETPSLLGLYEPLFTSPPDLAAENARLREALEWYGEQARLARLVHSEGDKGRHALADDGGMRARAALADQKGGAA